MDEVKGSVQDSNHPRKAGACRGRGVVNVAVGVGMAVRVVWVMQVIIIIHFRDIDSYLRMSATISRDCLHLDQ